MHEVTSFITLTYADEHLPENYSVSKRVWQLFAKRLRKSIWKSNRSKIRYYAASEYGPLDMRPHYHAIIFGYDFRNDRQHFKNTAEGPLYTSDQLAEAWGFGFCTVGSVTYRSIKYCTGYIFDREYKDKAKARYTYTHPVTSDIVQLEPEFQLQSGGLGRSWFEKFKDDCFPSDFLVVEDRQVPVPRYYRLKLSEAEEKARKRRQSYHPLKGEQNRRKLASKANSTPERLRVRAEIHSLKLKKRKHSL